MQHGTTQLRGRHHNTTDNTIELLVAIIQLARKDATGKVTGVNGIGEKTYWQADAKVFLRALERDEMFF